MADEEPKYGPPEVLQLALELAEKRALRVTEATHAHIALDRMIDAQARLEREVQQLRMAVTAAEKRERAADAREFDARWPKRRLVLLGREGQ